MIFAKAGGVFSTGTFDFFLDSELEAKMRVPSVRRGLTLIELLVIFAIVAILLAFSLVAIVKVREAANIAQSKNNLKQIVLATHSFAAQAHGSLPRLGNSRTRLVHEPDGSVSAYPPEPGPSLFVQILPYIEAQSTVDKRGDFAVVPLFLSPADPTVGGALAVKAAVSSYAANGAVFIDASHLQTTFTDGTSNTIVFGEHYSYGCDGVAFPYWLEGTQNPVYGMVGHRPAFADTSDVSPATEGNPPISMPSPRPRLLEAPFDIPTFQVAPSLTDCWDAIPQTPHRSGMIVALADGSVRQLAPNISPSVFWGAVTPNKGEIPGLD